MNCSICGKPVVLSPSATERSQRFGQPPSFYTNLFTSHSSCFIEKRKADTVDLMRRVTTEAARRVVKL